MTSRQLCYFLFCFLSPSLLRISSICRGIANGSESNELAESGSPGSIGPAGLVEAQKRAILELHNAFRAIVKPPASNMMKMSWDKDLEHIAYNFAAKCIVAHNPDRHKQAKHYDWVGENIAWGTGMCGDKECGDVFEGVKRWFSENKNYHYATGQCSGKCTLYTQMVWWESNKLGCGAKRCGDRTILVCNYAPGGNYVGQRPYIAGKPCSCPKAMHCENNLCVERDQTASTKQELQPLAIPIPEIAKGKHMLPDGWTELTLNLTQADTGLTEYIWGINSLHQLFYLEQDNMLAKVDGTLHHVSAGQSGVWGVGIYGNVFFRRDVTEITPSGTTWQKVAGNLKQIDSGPAGVVWGVNRLNGVYCRAGISKETMPMGTGWKRLKGNLKYVSCGEFGCWGVNKRNNIYFRLGVTALKPEGEQWIILPGKLRMVESGPAGQTVGIGDNFEAFYRAGVTAVKPEGSSWVKMDVKLSHVSLGLRGIIGILLDGTVAIKRDFNPPDNVPTAVPSLSATDASPLEVQTFPTTNVLLHPSVTLRPTLVIRQPSVPAMGPIQEPTTPPMVSPALKADRPKAAQHNPTQSLDLVKSPSGEVQISPDLAKKILDMMKQKGNQSQSSHEEAAASTPQNSAQSLAHPAAVAPAAQPVASPASQASPVDAAPHSLAAQTQNKTINAPEVGPQTKATSQTPVAPQIQQPQVPQQQGNASAVVAPPAPLPAPAPSVLAAPVPPQTAIAPGALPKVAVAKVPQASAPLPAATTHRPPTVRKMTTVRVTKYSGTQLRDAGARNRLSTSTHSEMNHKVFGPTARPPQQQQQQQKQQQHQQQQPATFRDSGKETMDEMRNIGALGKKNLQGGNDLDGKGGEYLSGALPVPTRKPMPPATAPITRAVTVSWELTRSCCAIPDSVCPIPGDCTGYIECHNYRGVYKGCEREKMFNPITNICDYPRNVDCESVKLQPVTGPKDSPYAKQAPFTTIAPYQAIPAAMPTPGVAPARALEETAVRPAQQKPRIKTPLGDNEGVLREAWFGLGLNPELSSLTSNPRFPNTPDEYLVLDKFEAPPNAGDGYGQRLSTYYKAPKSGDYIFYLSCDNECELWVSQDTEEIHSILVLELKHGHFTSFRKWNTYVDEQTSRPIKLEHGKYFFMEAFMKEGTGGDNLSIGIRLPDGNVELPIANNLYLIPSDGTASYVGSRVSQEASRQTANEQQALNQASFQPINSPVAPQQYFGNAAQSSLSDNDMDLPLGRRRTSVKRSPR